MMGPAMGPPPPSTAAAQDTTDVDMSFLDQEDDPSSSSLNPPRSPYSASRALLRDLTLPAVPNMDIPGSPPGSPPPGLDALNAKFDNFLKLKRTQGVHFNERLAASSALRNPALMDKLLAFVGVETDFVVSQEDDGSSSSSTNNTRATGQYATTLATDLWDPAGFPEGAYKGPLRRTQELRQKERERARGEPVDFVTASAASVSAPASAPTSRSGTPGLGSGAVPAATTGKRKTRFDA
ncbi:hypothetical protein B0T17DRAFT_522620 [Bombardia bombarda]|uniref:HCNGP-like protein n=1 Tax=Bombardia bombarda TaxID=252184 RepID=A0AA39X752_9PEZI|nr:hypothetical protein B0T17DRAFT_522620 [Bombardia bombarda]